MIAQCSRISQAFVEMRNEIAKTFKKLVLSVYSNCDGDFNLFVQVLKELVRQHEDQNERYDHDEELMSYFEGCEEVSSYTLPCYYESYFMQYMERKIFEFSMYSDLDIEFSGLYEFGVDYDSFSAAFRDCCSRALNQFAKGRNLEERMFKQLVIVSITEEYKGNNIKLTLRQLYYQMVSKNFIPNLEKQYKNLIQLTGSMRENNVLELDEFADNTRVAIRYSYQKNVVSFIDNSINQYRYCLDTRDGQKTYIEVWVEKEALRSVFKPITDELDVPLFICRGYPSTSSLFEQAKFILRKTEYEEIEKVIILYFGDHDPSGKQIPEAIQNIFHQDYQMKFVKVVPCALKLEQVREYKLPPNPAKLTDPRADGYIRKYGVESWELDAVPPLELQNIIRNRILNHTNKRQLNSIIKKQEKDRQQILDLKVDIMKKVNGGL
ncbi:hypothetical protein AM501_09945 [Aneurinibacillus migulanus]|uniref:hypothetical protein n=1 Tax=Aneurinibacillus migulanus TaxID=47500 RepID=UPI0005BC7941|nr:hypothetical protein [Aneurinibacillus migulanus]KIV56466.1 hypothetical protein TS64_09360 [Aneurinibacillus migulanus]KPD08474.1 hypothetical protein AM501_09945 [Aneurinibacillus migulanus]